MLVQPFFPEQPGRPEPRSSRPGHNAPGGGIIVYVRLSIPCTFPRENDGAVAWGLGSLAIWLSLWPLVIFGYVPIWLGFLIASINIRFCYLPSQEAQHDIIADEGEPL